MHEECSSVLVKWFLTCASLMLLCHSELHLIIFMFLNCDSCGVEFVNVFHAVL